MSHITYEEIRRTRVLIRGAGDLASGIAHRLFRSGFRVCLIEVARPTAVRRTVAFCEAIYDGNKTVERITAVHIHSPDEIETVWSNNQIPLLIDPDNHVISVLQPHVEVDAILAKRNLGTRLTDAPLVIGLGPGFNAGDDVHVVIETNRGHNLGRLIFEGSAEANTGLPGSILGYNAERVFRAPCEGTFTPCKKIGDLVATGEEVAQVAGIPIKSAIDGVLRGLLRKGIPVTKGMKAGDVDPRGDLAFCTTISDKARTLGGAVMEAILSELPKQKVLL